MITILRMMADGIPVVTYKEIVQGLLLCRIPDFLCCTDSGLGFPLTVLVHECYLRGSRACPNVSDDARDDGSTCTFVVSLGTRLSYN